MSDLLAERSPSVAPAGAWMVGLLIPRLAPWATLCRASGAEKNGIPILRQNPNVDSEDDVEVVPTESLWRPWSSPPTR